MKEGGNERKGGKDEAIKKKRANVPPTLRVYGLRMTHEANTGTTPQFGMK